MRTTSTGDPWEDEGFGAEDEWEGKESGEADLEDEDGDGDGDGDGVELPEEDDEPEEGE